MRGVFPHEEDQVSELNTIDDAFSVALEEVGDSKPAPEGEVEEAFVDDVAEQPTNESLVDTEDDVEEDLFADLEVDGVNVEDETELIDLEGMAFELPGVDEPVSFQELRDGYLRQADYTRKRQADSEFRRQNEKAVKLWDAIQADPVAVARQIATEVGLIEGDVEAAKSVEFSVFNTAEAVEAEIARRVDEAVNQHPAVAEANEQRARTWIASEFERIEQAHGVTLGPKSRQAMLQFAADRGVADLDLVYNHFVAQKQSRGEAARQVAQAAPGRPKGRAQDQQVAEEVDSIEEAWALAEAGVEA